MARSQRSPRMRDHWRDEGHRKEDTIYRGRQRERSIDHRSLPEAAKQRERSIDVEVKIKGRASIGEAHRHPTPKHERDKARKPSPDTERRSGRSPHRQRQREGSYEHRWEVDEDRHRDRSHQRKSRRPHSDERRRSRSRSPHRVAATSYRDRQRSPISYHPRRTAPDLDTKRRYPGSHHSRPSSPSRAEYYSNRREGKPPLAGDTYIPSARRLRSRSPRTKDYKEPSKYDRRSPAPRDNHLKGSHRPRREHDLFDDYRPRTREYSRDSIRQPRTSSRGRYREVAHPRGSSTTLREISQRPAKRRRSSRSPRERDSSRRDHSMQSTHRIQVLDSTSRPQSPPRPIPSFDANGQPPGPYPMHASRPSRLQLNTQHPHSASPQWTPVSSHHGSPQSASPYGHGRGGWTGQPQQYHGQPG